MIIIGKKLDMEKLPESCYDCPFCFEPDEYNNEYCYLSFAMDGIGEDQRANYCRNDELYLPDNKRLDSCPLKEVDG